jgi:hypothetical protein
VHLFFTAGAQRAQKIFFTLRSQRRCGAFAFSPLRRRGRKKDFSLSVLSVAAVHLFFTAGAQRAEKRFFTQRLCGAFYYRTVYFKPLSQMCQNVSGFMPVLLRNDHDRTA